VKHAGPETFDLLEDLLGELREVPELTERKTGVFYRGSRAFLHFHDDLTGPYADVRLSNDSDFLRVRVRTAAEKKRLLREVRAATRS
jgi:hypothetical protein